MTASRLFDLLVALLYLTGSITYPLGLVFRKPALKSIATWTSVVAFALHSVDLVLRVVDNGLVNFHQGQFYLNLLAWIIVLIFFVLRWKLKHDFLTMVTTPLALVLFSSSLAIHTQMLLIPQELGGLWFSLHVGTSFVSLGLMAMASCAGVVYLYLEKKIKTKAKLPGFSQDLPSLETFDRANHWAVSIGFPLYTISLLSGFIWAAFTWKSAISWDPKEVVSVIIWLLFALLFHQRLSLGWRGRKPAHSAIILFVLCLASLIGVNFLLPTHHSFRP